MSELTDERLREIAAQEPNESLGQRYNENIALARALLTKTETCEKMMRLLRETQSLLISAYSGFERNSAPDMIWEGQRIRQVCQIKMLLIECELAGTP